MERFVLTPLFLMKRVPELLGEFFCDEIAHELIEFSQSIIHFLLDTGKMACFRLVILATIFTTSLAPLAGIENIYHPTGADEVKRIDHPAVIQSALPEIMEPLSFL